jgi:hypothetical protein
VEDQGSGEIVSSLGLIPWVWRVGAVTLRAAEQAIVGTLPDYRGRGLIRALNVRFKEMMREEGFAISHIQGIPYFYRQFGYEYAIPLEGGWEIRSDQLPAAANDAYRCRRATAADIPTLMALFETAGARLDISTVRDEATWRYMFEYGVGTNYERDFWVVVDQEDRIVAYWGIELYGFGTGLIVSEASRMKADMIDVVLARIAELAVEQEKPYIRLKLNDEDDLVRAAQGYRARDAGHYAWQLHIPDEVRILENLRPVLEGRLAGTPYEGLTHTLHLDLYRRVVHLDFVAGRLGSITVDQDGTDSRVDLPPQLLPVIVTGYRTLEDLRAVYHDVGARGMERDLMAVLFPKLQGYLYTNY